MAKKYAILALGLFLSVTQTNSMSYLRRFKPVVVSFAATYATYFAKPVGCEPIKKEVVELEMNHIPRPTCEYFDFFDYTSKNPAGVCLKPFDQYRDLKFVVDCFNQTPVLFDSLRGRFNDDDILSRIEYNHAIVLFVEGVPVGFGIYYPNYIDYLGVDQRYRGKGYGTILLNHMVSKISEQKSGAQIHLSVSKDNSIAIDLYQKNGFQCRCEGSKYWLRCSKLKMDKK